MEQRLQKLLAAAGIGSRRFCEGLVSAGRITVNGLPVTELGTKADPEADEILVDGLPLAGTEEKVHVILNKPLEYVATVRDPHAKQTVMDLVKEIPQRIYPVGRLDADTAGLIILSNDGDFAQQLTHPSHQIPKTYRAVVRGEVSEWAAADLRHGIMLDDGMTAPAKLEWVDYDESNNATIIDITIHEGRNRQVRRMFRAVGHPVLALTRTQIGPIKLKGIAPGAWRRLNSSEVDAILKASNSQCEVSAEVVSVEVEPKKDAPAIKPGKAQPRQVVAKQMTARENQLRQAAKELTDRLNAANESETASRKPRIELPDHSPRLPARSKP